MSANPEQEGIELTEDAITEILCRLPVKTLIRLSFICKTWQSIIKSPGFISKYSKQNSTNPHSSGTVLVLSRYSSQDKFDMSLCSVEAPETPISINFPFLGKNFLEIVGVSHGLVCVRRSKKKCHLAICNPSTRKYFNIPKPNKWSRLTDEDLAVGFTFDPYSNDYKLIKLVRSYGVDRKLLSEIARIYTMSSGCWREIDIHSPIPSDLRLDLSSDVVVIDSVFYWPCHHFKSYRASLLSFNMRDESFGLISAPQHFRHLSTDTHTRFHLSQLKGEIAFFGISDLGVFTAWTLNADSTVGWGLKYSVDLVPLIATAVEIEEIWSDLGTFRLIGCARDCEIVLEASKFSDDSLFSYDLVNEEMKKLCFGARYYYFSADEYTQSLLPVSKDE